MSVYLDYNATAPIDERVLDFMIDVYKNDIGNADSRTHNFGEKARNVVETARKQVASLLQVNSDEVFLPVAQLKAIILQFRASGSMLKRIIKSILLQHQLNIRRY